MTRGSPMTSETRTIVKCGPQPLPPHPRLRVNSPDKLWIKPPGIDWVFTSKVDCKWMVITTFIWHSHLPGNLDEPLAARGRNASGNPPLKSAGLSMAGGGFYPMVHQSVDGLFRNLSDSFHGCIPSF